MFNKLLESFSFQCRDKGKKDFIESNITIL